MMKLIISFAIVACAFADVSHLFRPTQTYSSLRDVPILRLESDISPDGNYKYAYETGNGIAAQEQGLGGQAARGSFSWTSPEGVPVAIQYVADENGYQPQGNVLPTPPPVPQAILRSLEWIRTHPQQPEPRRF
ncbi:endocuticle structural glycoprotein SgAbd-2-like [Aethina tumida]|uniref:endocuticle structural glycoprotein SgAbd-2-like n=1 Tax=Aethina tumida TaxID=116153 RepID=UPI00096B1B19|nr:endocuticle structural glycoprotein SgAbd-2-like [Aethina tumida]